MNFVSIRYIFVSGVSHFAGLPFRNDFMIIPITFGHYMEVGAAVSRDGSFVLVLEFMANRIQKFWLRGPKANTLELFITFQGKRDNIKTTTNGTFRVAMNIINSLLAVVPTGQEIDADGNVLKIVNFEAESALLL